MANYPVDPTYDAEIRQIEDTDHVKASTVLNPVIEQMIGNTAAVKQSTDQLGANPIAISLPTTGWTAVSGYYTITVTVTGVRYAGYTQLVGPDSTAKSNVDEYGSCGVTALPPTEDDALTFWADSVPGVALSVNVIQLANMGEV
jgi:hypothetical protein